MSTEKAKLPTRLKKKKKTVRFSVDIESNLHANFKIVAYANGFDATEYMRKLMRTTVSRNADLIEDFKRENG